jgi:hypothetical protein
MSNLKKSYPELAAHTATNWDSVVLLSLIEIADKVVNESRRRTGESPDQDRGLSHDMQRAG